MNFYFNKNSSRYYKPFFLSRERRYSTCIYYKLLSFVFNFQTCPGKCEELQPCVQCLQFRSGPYMDDDQVKIERLCYFNLSTTIEVFFGWVLHQRIQIYSQFDWIWYINHVENKVFIHVVQPFVYLETSKWLFFDLLLNNFFPSPLTNNSHSLG